MGAKGLLNVGAGIMPIVELSIWLSVFARGRMVWFGVAAIEFLRTLALETPAALSRRPFLGLDDGVVVECNFCWWRSSRSLLAKHLVQD